jgi:hypothetical protein
MPTVISGDTGIDRIQNGVVQPEDLAQKLTLMTAQASTSGSSIDFTGIPSWAKKIKVMFSAVSTSATTGYWGVRLGDSGGFESTGYNGTFTNTDGSAAATISDMFRLESTNALATSAHGQIDICLLDSSANLWVASGSVGFSNSNGFRSVAGSKALSATLDRLAVVTTAGAFDAGTINIMYE